MISFTIQYDEATMLWRYQPKGKTIWSEPMRYGKLMAAVGREIQLDSLEKASTEDKRWNMPLPHQAKSAKSDRAKHEELMDLYEIRGGKVQRIAANARERTEQETNELLAALEGVDLGGLIDGQ